MTYGNTKWNSLDGGDGKPKPRGLAALSPERRKQIASMGGQASSTQFSGERARLLGAKGGRSERKKK